MEGKLKILFIEDVRSDAELIWREIEKNKIAFEKLLVDNKKDFLEGLQSFEPDLIVSDYSLPQFDGMKALLLRNELAPFIPFILVTGSINEEVAVECMKAGADDYILKDNLSRIGPAVNNSVTKIELLKEKRAAEEKLIKSEQRLQKAQSIANVGNWELDLSTKMIWSSEEAMRIYGLYAENQEFPLSIIQEIPLPEYRKILNEALDRLLKYNELYEAEFKIKRVNDGAIRSIYSKAEMIVGLDDERVKVIGVIQDITQRKRAEEALHESEEIFRHFMEYSPIYVFFKDENIRSLSLSKNYEIMLGKPIAELLGKNMYELFPSVLAKNMVADDLRILKEGKVITVEEELNGRFYSTIKFPIFIEGKPLYLAGYTIDITQNKLDEDKLKQFQLLLKSSIESPKDMIILSIDKHYKYMYYNTFHQEIMFSAYGKNIKLGMNILDCITNEEDRLKAKSNYDRAMAGESHITVEEYGELERYYYETRYNPIVNDSNEIIGATAFSSDITNRIRIDKELAENERKYRSIFENVQDLYYESALDGTILEVSPSISTLSNGQYHREDLIGKSMYEFYSYPGERELLLKELTSKGSVTDFEIKLKNRNGSFIPCSVSSKIYFNKDGSPEKIIGSMRDISERKKAEEALHNNLAFSESLLKTIPFGMDIVDEEGTVLFMSDNFELYFGEKAIGEKCWMLYRDDKKQCSDCPLMHGITVGETEAYEARGVLGNRIFEINHTGMMYQGKRAMLEIFQDITDRKENEVELIRAKEKAEESDKLKTAFLHNISHEIRTPMNAIVGFSTLLGEPDVDTPTRQSYIEVIMQSSNHLLAIITDIVDIANIEANLVRIFKNEINLNEIFKSLYDQFLPRATEKKLILTCITSLDYNNAYIMTDNTKLFQILSNLINNAIKFTDNGEIKIEYRIKDNLLEFCVSDTGIGIPHENQGMVFDRFYQVQNSVSRLYEGVGLGLSISRAYVELLGGNMWLTSEPGMGTSFCFTIPYEKPVINTETNSDNGVPNEFAFTEKKTILVAEDIDSNFKLVKYFLSGTNTRIIRAVNGSDAVEQCLNDKSIDLILMDIKMPVMDGYTAVKLIREKNAVIPIIAQTAYIDDKDKAFECGCSGFISKPFDKKNLLKVIREFI
jgi:PAS domain S-box-containing protein